MLSKDVLGVDLFNARNAFCNKTRDELLAIYGDDNGIRLAACKADADAIINHFKTAGILKVPGTGLNAGTTAVTGLSVTGTIE